MFVPPPGGESTAVITTPDDLSMENRINRLNTSEFIAADPVYVALRTRGSTRTASGAFDRQMGAQRPQQRFKLIMQSPAGGSIEATADDGITRRVDYVLLGEWDCVFEVGDYWDDNANRRYEITAIIAENPYERRAVVVGYGNALEGG